jgi:hypothetical protein
VPYISPASTDGRIAGKFLPLRRDGHAAVDQRAPADPATLVDDDATELLGVEDARVARDVPVDGETEEVADRLQRPGA